MVVSKSDLLQFVTEYQQENKRPCPKSAIISTHGEDALPVLKELTSDGSINCRRGRNGGYFAASTVQQTEEPVVESEPVAEVENDVADQFAALQAKLAALEEAESEEQISANP